MSTGISISSINQIKELAEEKRYAEALEILDTQNLDKSINPQFLRISGEIFRKNKRYYDSRRILLKAHQMSPQGTRIIYELIQLYLELGYFTLANKYYEEYLFYVGQEDTQKEYVEYIIKKANGADVKELASILIPILERMPEDNWNYEAVLLYDKLDRKDKALDESRFILENFKDSIYVDRVISYIDDKLDVDSEFFVYPKEEQEEDTDTFGDLIELEKDILAKDHLAMYPPEARIMVEADDQDGFDANVGKEKKNKTKKSKKVKTSKKDIEKDTSKDEISEQSVSEGENTGSDKESEEKRNSDNGKESESISNSADKEGSEDKKGSFDELLSSDESGETMDEAAEPQISDEERIKQEREAALDRLLSKKFDAEKIRESAKQIADSVKGIDTSKAKKQVKNVTDAVVDNVKKASDTLGEAVGTKAIMEASGLQEAENPSDEILDGIIESVLEPPKQKIGQVVMNEELDALIPDSLEAMTVDEIADIEARKEEQERVELEALEASLRMEEEKRSKKKRAKDSDLTDDSEPENESEYSELKLKFIQEFMNEDVPAQSLGFITVVHSDVDGDMEEGIPDTAQMLRQMIDNKEFYRDENSLGFESEESYKNHGFEVESYNEKKTLSAGNFVYVQQDYNSDVYKVEDIFAKEPILSFDEMVPEEVNPITDYELSDEWVHKQEPEPVSQEICEVEEIDEAQDTMIESVDIDFDDFVSDYTEELTGEQDNEKVFDEFPVSEETKAHTPEYSYVEDTVDNTGDFMNEEALEDDTVDSLEEVIEDDTADFMNEEALKDDTSDFTYEETLEDNTAGFTHEEALENHTVDFVEEEVLEADTSDFMDENILEDDIADSIVDNSVTDFMEEELTMESPDTLYGEQLSFDMPLDNVESRIDNDRKKRIELRSRIIISDRMEKKLLALKETK
ncbi:MAG: hypothetical protein ACI4GW_00040 [Lachnospiraceae bacterium]